jgi:nitrogen-specific signal transduction histidine kinase
MSSTAVLAQNAEVVERARTQAGNLAHALKTPLSVLANAANAPEKRDDDLARLVASQVDTVRKQVDYHLSRAQAAASVQVPGMRTAVEPVIQGLVRVMRAGACRPPSRICSASRSSQSGIPW